MIALDFLTVVIGVFIKPIKWRLRMEKVSVPTLIDELHNEINRTRRLRLPAATIAYLIRYRVMYSLKWRKKRCLITSLLLMYYLGRANEVVTIHIGCSLGENNKLSGHSWITGQDLKIKKRYLPSEQNDEIFSKTFFPKVCRKKQVN